MGSHISQILEKTKYSAEYKYVRTSPLSSFEEMSPELQLRLFTYVPFKSLAQCVRLNRSSRDIINDNWHLMRRLEGEEKVSTTTLVLYNEYSKKEQKEPKINCGLVGDHTRFVVRYKPKKACYTPECAKFFNVKTLRSSRLDQMHWLRSCYYNYETPIKSIGKGLEQHLEYILRYWNNGPMFFMNHRNFTGNNNEYFTALYRSIMKFGTKASKIDAYGVKLTPAFFHFVNTSCCPVICISGCIFTDPYLLNILGNHFKEIEIGLSSEANAPIIIDNFLQQWKAGNYNNLNKCTFYIRVKSIYQHSNYLFQTFGELPKLVRGEVNEMSTTRADGKTLKLFYEDHYEVASFTFSTDPSFEKELRSPWVGEKSNDDDDDYND